MGTQRWKGGKGNCLQDSDGVDPWLAPADGWETLHDNKYAVFLSALLAGTARAGCKRTGSWFDPSVLPSWMLGYSLQEGDGNGAWPALEQAERCLVFGVHVITT